MRASVRWTDHGWGNKKGRLIVKLMGHNLGENKVIAENDNMFGIAGHEWRNETCEIIDHPVVKLECRTWGRLQF